MDVNIGKGITLTIDPSALPLTARDHVLYIGLRNILMDSHASVTKESNPNDLADVARAMAEKKLAALMSGEVRVASTREGDPVKAEAVRMATETIKSALRKAGRKVSDVDPKALREKALTLVTPELMAQAKARVDEMRGATGVDLGTLGL